MPEAAPLTSEDWQRVTAALRYMARDLHHRSFAVGAERRELLWQEMDACLALADRCGAPNAPLALASQDPAEPSAASPGPS